MTEHRRTPIPEGGQLMSSSFTARVAVDNNTAEVVLELDVDGTKVVAQIDPRLARQIVIQLLEAAREMDDLRNRRFKEQLR